MQPPLVPGRIAAVRAARRTSDNGDDMSDQPPSSSSGGSGQMKNPFEGLTADKIKAAGLPTQLMLGGAVVFLIFSFFDWYGASAFGVSVDWNAWHYFPGILATLLMIGVGVVALLMLLQGPNQNFVYGALGGAGLSILLMLWYWGASAGESIPSSVDSSPDFGFYICIIAALVATYGAFMTFQAFNKSRAS
jgi:hypothetical protein